MKRVTYWYEKLLASVINVTFVVIIFIPLFFLTKFDWKFLLISIFFIYNLFFLIFNKNRALGMIILKTYWKKNYPFINCFIFIILYTLSFSTLLFYIYFPLDLFWANMLFLQLPTIILKKTTFHGWLSGNMIGVKRVR